MSASIAGAAFLASKGLQGVLGMLNGDGEEARIAGGAVRNALMGMEVSDVDIATTALPDETIRRAEAAGLRAVKTGFEHGTVTVIAGHQGYEVTTLRADIETDGRRAKVAFGRSWQMDAERRDFTVNALYAGADGTITDLVGGLADIEKRHLRFIGDADQRIIEDGLRILRFFRFFAWFGGGRPDAEGLKACARHKAMLADLSAERIWAELKKLLSAPDPARALLWMRQAGVLSAVLPESEKWGIDAIHGLVETGRAQGWEADPLLRLMAILPPDSARMAGLALRLKLSRAEASRLENWASTPMPDARMDDKAFARHLYRSNVAAVRDRVLLAAAKGDSEVSVKLAFLESWQKPAFPVNGKDLAARGLNGPALGAALKALEDRWIGSDFTLSRQALLDIQ
ncbi:MAG: CCA tRNA nucleotidyltransferase [Rhizobiaceae bacterium]